MLHMSDPVLQGKLETIMGQLGWTITGRTVSELGQKYPMLSYRLEGEGDHARLLELIPQFSYGLTREPEYRKRGNKASLRITLRQLAPTEVRTVGPRTWGE